MEGIFVSRTNLVFMFLEKKNAHHALKRVGE